MLGNGSVDTPVPRQHLRNIQYKSNREIVFSMRSLWQLQQKQPVHSDLASGPAGTRGHIYFHCQDLCFFPFFDHPH
jgi:hypothetical protein